MIDQIQEVIRLKKIAREKSIAALDMFDGEISDFKKATDELKKANDAFVKAAINLDFERIAAELGGDGA